MNRPLKIILRVVGVLVALLLAVTLFLYLRFKPDEYGRVVPWGESIDITVLPNFRASLLEQSDLKIYEGLPHQGWEHELLRSEIKSKETTKIHGFHFYSNEISPSTAHRDLLVAALSNPEGIMEWAGMKLCGGYHPDYAVRWKDAKGAEFDALICFGCHEIKLYGAGSQLYADLSKEVYNPLKEVLSEYEDQRPKPNQKG